MNNNKSWKELIEKAMKNYSQESWETIVACTITEDQLNILFDAGCWSKKGLEFTLWTKNRVYFPVVYDGSEWVDSVSRNPCIESKYHVGG